MIFYTILIYTSVYSFYVIFLMWATSKMTIDGFQKLECVHSSHIITLAITSRGDVYSSTSIDTHLEDV